MHNGIKTIAFPCISAGIYGHPFDEACAVALRTIGDFLRQDESISEVLLSCFSNADYIQFCEIFDAEYDKYNNEN